MQTLRDATILLVLLLVLASVRVSRVDPIAFDLVPEARAGTSQPSLDPTMAGRMAQPAGVEPLPAQDPSTMATPGSCQVRTLRIDTVVNGRRVLAIQCDALPQVATVKASKIG